MPAVEKSRLTVVLGIDSDGALDESIGIGPGQSRYVLFLLASPPGVEDEIAFPEPSPLLAD